jgi:hypothetical protein
MSLKIEAGSEHCRGVPAGDRLFGSKKGHHLYRLNAFKNSLGRVKAV